MHRQVQYVAEDGTIFSSPEGCAEYERHLKFMNALTVYLHTKFPSITEENLVCFEQLWIEIFNDPKAFLSVVTSAMPRTKRGRPVSKKCTTILTKTAPTAEAIKELPEAPKISTPTTPVRRESVLRAKPQQSSWRAST